MHLVLKTLLNHVERLKGFVYESSRLVGGVVPRDLRRDAIRRFQPGEFASACFLPVLPQYEYRHALAALSADAGI